MLVSLTAFWAVIEEVLNITEPADLTEIGALAGEMTEKLCGWARPHDATVHIVEPVPDDKLERIAAQYTRAVLHVGLSLDVLPRIDPTAFYIVDGDHNYYTVYHELKLIAQRNSQAVIILHDVGWPWGRRDLYYNVDSIPPEARNAYVMNPVMGIVPGNPGLLENAGFRDGRYAFARTEGGPKNGVRTAVEDFLSETSGYQLFTVDCVFGLGILLPDSLPQSDQVRAALDRYASNPLVTLLEQDRLQYFTASFGGVKQTERLDAPANPLPDSSIESMVGEMRDAYSARFQTSLKDWLFYHQHEIVFSKSLWLGVPALKNPLDLWIYQQLIHQVKPDILIEIGSLYGGSTLYFAHIFDAIGHGQVISIDKDRSLYQVQHPRITELTGDSGSSDVIERVRQLCQFKRVMLIHDGSHNDADVLRDLRLYAEFISGGSYIIVEDGLVDLFPTETETDTAGQRFEPGFEGLGPLWAIAAFIRENRDFEIDHGQELYWLTQTPHGFLKCVRESQPLISVVIVVYNMQRAATRTLQSFTAAYQQVSPDLYEVIVVENGSSEPLSREWVEALGPNFRYYAFENAAPSPVPALNFGVQQATGRMVGVMIDGARIVTPGVLRYALRALKAYNNPVVATLGWYVGSHSIRQRGGQNYSEQIEDELLERINWRENGYRLFETSTLVSSNSDGYFSPSSESNCLFLLRRTYDAMGGFDERFDAPGGGIANLDFYYRLCDDPTTELIVLLGEGNFHQIHGGISTNCEDDEVYNTKLERWMAQYSVIHGRPYEVHSRIPEFWGHLPIESASFLKLSAQRYSGSGSIPVETPPNFEAEQLRQQLDSARMEREQLGQEYARVTQELQQLQTQHSDQLAQQLQQFQQLQTQYNEQWAQQLQQLQAQYNEQRAQQLQIQHNAQWAQQRLTQIENTRGWRALSLWWNVKQRILFALGR